MFKYDRERCGFGTYGIADENRWAAGGFSQGPCARAAGSQMRDDFTAQVKIKVAQRAGWQCSNPHCRQPTSGPSDTEKAVTNVGVAAHISAASSGGPRYDRTMTQEERGSVENAIWLCQLHAKMVDDDPARYTRELLVEWKRGAEARAREGIERPGRHRETSAPAAGTQVVNAGAYIAPGGLTINGPVVLGPNAINITGPTVQPGAPGPAASGGSAATHAPDTPEEMVARLARDSTAARSRIEALALHGIEWAAAGAQALFERLQQLFADHPVVTVERGTHGVRLHGRRSTLGVGWEPGPYSNCLDGSWLGVVLWEGRRVPLVAASPLPEPRRTVDRAFEFDVIVTAAGGFETVWREKKRHVAGRVYSPEQLVAECVSVVAERVRRDL